MPPTSDLSRRAVITGVGAVTPIGNTAADYWRNLIAGVSGAGPIDAFDSSGFDVRIAALFADRLVTMDKERVFILAAPVGQDPIYLSQRDVRELQFAKAAISTGWHLLLQEFGVEQSDVQQVLLAGSFGTYLSPASAVRIGLVPKLPVLRIVSAGNVAGEGAKMVLLSAQERHGAQTLLEEIEYLELSDREDFNDLFVEQLAFPT